MTLKGMNCVFLNGEMEIQPAVVVSGNIKEMKLCHTGIKMQDEDVLNAVRDLSGHKTDDEELEVDLIRYEDYNKITKTAECLLRPLGLNIGSLVCYRECPPGTDMALVVASSRRIRLEDCRFTPGQWDTILQEMMTRIKSGEHCCEELSFRYWSWNPLKFSELSARRFVKILARAKKVSFYGNGFKFFPAPHHWQLLAREVTKLRSRNDLSLRILDTSELYWGSHGGIPPEILQQITNINNCIGSK